MPEPMLIGADVSQWQNDLGPNDLDFIVAKATQGTGFLDPHFQMHVQTAHARGQLVFAYHFGERNEGAGGAQNFLAAIQPVLGMLSGVMLDVEYQNEQTKLGPSYFDVLAWNDTIAAALPSMKRRIYTASWYWGSVLGNPPPPPGCGLWWANWVPGELSDVHQLAAQVTKPPFPDLPWPDYDIRQIAQTGAVGGIQPVDINISYLTRDELAGTEEDLTPEQDARLTACCKAIMQLGAAINTLANDEATRAKLIVHGDPTHYSLSKAGVDLTELKQLLPKAAS